MIFIKKKQAPPFLIAYSKTAGADFDGLGSLKAALRESLLQEQGYLCAYCMKRIVGTDVKIEHFVPRDGKNDLVYSNLFAVCKGGEGLAPQNQTCDTRKGNKQIALKPTDKNAMATIVYGSNGAIHSENVNYDAEINEALNLNNSSLVHSRETALKALQGLIAKQAKNKAVARLWLRKTKSKLMEGHDGKLEPYLGILLWYIDKRLTR